MNVLGMQIGKGWGKRVYKRERRDALLFLIHKYFFTSYGLFDKIIENKKKGEICVPKKGQKIKTNPKDRRLEIRIDRETIEKLDFIVNAEKKDRSKIIRLGIEKIYDELNAYER
jgi:hypothetical protein